MYHKDGHYLYTLVKLKMPPRVHTIPAADTNAHTAELFYSRKNFFLFTIAIADRDFGQS